MFNPISSRIYFSFAVFLEVILGIITCYLLDLYRCANRMQVPPFSVRGTLQCVAAGAWTSGSFFNIFAIGSPR